MPRQRIAIINDDEIYMDLMRDLLEEEGYKVRVWDREENAYYLIKRGALAAESGHATRSAARREPHTRYESSTGSPSPPRRSTITAVTDASSSTMRCHVLRSNHCRGSRLGSCPRGRHTRRSGRPLVTSRPIRAGKIEATSARAASRVAVLTPRQPGHRVPRARSPAWRRHAPCPNPAAGAPRAPPAAHPPVARPAGGRTGR
jgi:hypothetical protein